jgi:cob(I)alamin adenosyltransferase
MHNTNEGYIHIYTGDGKGKTTAALGLALRAAGAGLQVYIAQFLKKGSYREIKALERFADRITLEQFGLGRFVRGKPQKEDIAAAAQGLQRVKSVMAAGGHQLIVLDEANVAVASGLFPLDALLELIDLKPDELELVITGRGAAPEVIERADLVSEVKSLKHYFEKGVPARVGIEK